jgi:hypothetical protein
MNTSAKSSRNGGTTTLTEGLLRAKNYGVVATAYPRKGITMLLQDPFSRTKLLGLIRVICGCSLSTSLYIVGKHVMPEFLLKMIII